MSGYRQPQEEDRLPRRAVSLVLAGTVAFALLLSACAWAILVAYERRLRPSGRFPERALAPARAIEQIEQTVYGGRPAAAALESAQRARLQGYGWADPGRAAVRIPIGRAIELIAEDR